MRKKKNIVLSEEEKFEKEKKYIKWPSRKKVFITMITVCIGMFVFSVLIAAGDQIGKFLLNFIIR